MDLRRARTLAAGIRSRVQRGFLTHHRPLASLALLLALSIVASISMSPGFRISLTTPGLDPSFVYGFNYAAAHGLRWGHDFISTYGPYGYVLSTMDVGHLMMRKITFTLLLVAGTAIVTAVYVWSVPAFRTPSRLILLVLLIYACSVQPPEYQWLTLCVLVIFVGVHEGTRKSLILFLVAGMLAGFYILIKFSLGCGALLTVLIGCALSRRPPLIALRFCIALCGATAGFVIGWLSYRGRLDDIGQFLVTGWEVSQGYSSSMSWVPAHWWIGVVGFLTWGILVVVWGMVQRGPRTVVSLAVLAPALFVGWKHSMVRQDDAHVRFLITFGIFVMVILLVEAWPAWRRWKTLLFVGILLLSLLVPWYSLAPGALNGEWALEEGRCKVDSLRAMLLGPFKFCLFRDVADLRHLSGYRKSLAQQSKIALLPAALPSQLLALIANSSVDVYPWAVHYVPANQLSWSNRPLPASFSTYAPSLDSLNAAFFGSANRPPYLLWHTPPRGDAAVLSIDGRHLFWDEPLTLRVILDSYDVAATAPSIILLHARTHPRFAAIQSVGTLIVPWNSWTQVPQVPGVLLAHASIVRPGIMRMVRAAFREDPVFVSLRFSSGAEVRHRMVPDNTAQGLWLSPFPETVDELHTLLRSGVARRVVAVRFSVGRLARLYPPIAVSWSQLMPVEGSWAGAQ